MDKKAEQQADDMPQDKAPASEVVEEQNVTEAEEPAVNDEPEAPESDKDSEDYGNEEKPSDVEALEDRPKGPNIFQKLFAKYKAHKKIALPATGALLLILIFVMPFSRYAVLGLVIKKDVQLTIVDSQTSVPISGVELSLRGKTAKTDGDGKAVIKGVKVGRAQLKAVKKYYKDTTENLIIGLRNKPQQFKVEATGRQIPVHVVNKITGENITGVHITAAGTEAQTDQNGETTIVLPADHASANATVKADGYNDQTVQISVREASVKANTFALVPVGKVYFLSKKSGKIDVVKTDLDGDNRQTVLAGTGNEEDGNTILLASRDWKYLALQSRREGKQPQLYLLDTGNDKLTEIDSGDATFSLVGWSGHNFIYKVGRNNVQPWQPKAEALKSYNADGKQLTTLDETKAEGISQNDYAREVLDNVYILKDRLVYIKRWSASYYSVYRLAGKRMGIISIKPGGSNKQTIKDFDVGNNGYIQATLSAPNEIYFGIYNAAGEVFYEYEAGKLHETKEFKAEAFYKPYPTFLVSPSGTATFWYEPRDGKNTLLTGNIDGGAAKEILVLSEYRPYGWFGDDYLLVSKNNSELSILSAEGLGNKGQVLKISDYHKPDQSFYGYGYGYGGL